jgi:hypothetical protein
LKQAIKPKPVKAGLLDGHDPDRRTQPLGGLALQPLQKIKQGTMVTALDFVFRHLVAAWRKRRHQPSLRAEFY